MRRLTLLVVIMSVFLAACGRRALPPYEAENILNSARGSATAIIAQAQTESFASPTATPLNTATPTITPTFTAAPTDTPTIAPTETPLPTETPTPTEEVAESGAIPQRVADADAANGEVLFTLFQPEASFACSTCHNAVSEDRLIGPGLLNIAVRAETRVDGQSAEEYIFESIVNPSVFIVDTFTDGLMPANWAEIYSEDEIYDIMAYLYTLQE